MLLRLLAAVAIIASINSVPALAQKPKPRKIDGKIEWVYDYEEGKLLSESTDRPMFVVIRCER